MTQNYLVQPRRNELWRAFDQLMDIARQVSSSSSVARDLLVYSHCMKSFDVREASRIDSSNRKAAVVVIAHAVNGGDDREFGTYLRQKGLTELEWLKDRVLVHGKIRRLGVPLATHADWRNSKTFPEQRQNLSRCLPTALDNKKKNGAHIGYTVPVDGQVSRCGDDPS